jgi:hypothetical protein
MTITRREFVRHCLAAVAALPLARNRTASALYESVHPSLSGNPIFPGWYADPEGRIFENEYWVFPTYSAPYDEQIFFDAFSSRDLVTWTKHPRVLRAESFSWVKRAVWAPSVVRKGGWRHCNIAKLNSDLTGFAHFDDGSTFREITPAGYVEGSWMFVKDGKYYFMWSEGGWTGPDYAVAYAIGTSNARGGLTSRACRAPDRDRRVGKEDRRLGRAHLGGSRHRCGDDRRADDDPYEREWPGRYHPALGCSGPRVAHCTVNSRTIPTS